MQFSFPETSIAGLAQGLLIKRNSNNITINNNNECISNSITILICWGFFCLCIEKKKVKGKNNIKKVNLLKIHNVREQIRSNLLLYLKHQYIYYI